MRRFVGLFVFGWFFAFDHALQKYEGVQVRSIVGAFATRDLCEAARSEVEGLLRQVYGGGKISPTCINRQDV